MKHVKTLNTNTLKDTMKKGGCGECQTSCQSACKTSCTVGNQSCETANRRSEEIHTGNWLQAPMVDGIIGALPCTGFGATGPWKERVNS